MRLLVVEDDSEIRNFLRTSLEAETFAVDCAGDGASGSYLARTNDYDLVILDIVMPKKNGSEVCKEIRSCGRPTPILVLTVQSSVEEKLHLFDSGADDYLTKPFSFYELLARIRALLRRPHFIEPEIIEMGNVRLNSKTHRAIVGNKEIYLTRKEFSLLEYLMRNRGKIVTRGTIMEHVWNIDGDLFSNTIEAHILNLRRKIERSGGHKIIRTVPGRGYMAEETGRMRLNNLCKNNKSL